MLTRRQLLAGGAAAALFAGGCRRAGPATAALRERYDVCVIGSGFAGLPIALRAAEAGLATAVLEAGGWPGDAAAHGFGFTSSGEIDYPLAASRVIAVGGTSNHWEGTVNRMRPADFRARSEFGMDADWPFGYEALAPFYCRAEQELSVRGFPPVPGAEPARGCPYPEPEARVWTGPRLALDGRPLRFFPLAQSLREGGPVRLVDREVARLEALPGADLLPGHAVVRLVPRDASHIDSALARGPDGAELRIRAGAFVLAAGVVESARLLLLSRSRFHPDGIGNARDLVGRFFCEHPTYRWELRPRSLGALFPDGLYDGEQRSYDWSDAFRREGLSAVQFQLREFRGETLILKLQPELEPRPENRVALSAARRDAFGDPVPDLRLSFSERDRKTLERGLAVLAAQAEALGADPARIERRLQWRSHPAGTLRMAVDESAGVVDPDQKVFGIDNLYVSGAAVFPTSGTANPTLTVVALAQRLADHLLGGPG